MSAKTERNCLILRVDSQILRVDSQYCSTLPRNLEILKIHSRESPRSSSRSLNNHVDTKRGEVGNKISILLQFFLVPAYLLGITLAIKKEEGRNLFLLIACL